MLEQSLSPELVKFLADLDVDIEEIDEYDDYHNINIK